MRKLVILSALLVASSAHAQVIYKCRGASGALVYQNAPCASTQTTLGVKAYQAVASSPAPVPASTQPRAAYVAPSQPATVYYSPAVAPRPVQRDAQRAQCAVAKSNRQATLAQVGLARTVDLIRQLDESVYDACKGL